MRDLNVKPPACPRRYYYTYYITRTERSKRSILQTAKNALEYTYFNLKFQKVSGGNAHKTPILATCISSIGQIIKSVCLRVSESNRK